MKKIALAIFSMGLFFSLPTYGQYSAGSGAEETTDQAAEAIKKLASYFGYDITNPAESPFASLLLDYTLSMSTKGNQLLNVFFGATPVNYPNFSDFTTNTNYDSFNKQANILYTDTFNTPASDSSTGVSVVEKFDQKNYQYNPVNQSIVNSLANPDTSLCADDGSNCNSQNQVMYTALQDVVDSSTKYLPSETQFFTNTIVSKFASQLNVDTLLGPFIFSTAAVQTSAKGGLPSSNQLQVAANYIRNVTNAVIPPDSMSSTDYQALFKTATTEITSSMISDGSDLPIKAARHDLMNYLLRRNVYVAQTSLPTSNFYRSLDARMPQTVSSTDGTTSTSTSQAFNEFVMATWRLYSPTAASGAQWVDKINTASAATTQKEIAIILSEINYQIYLSRQTQERLLLTNSLIALQSAANNQPNNRTTSVSVSGTATTS
ncbi:MAG: hypothetical protein KBB94_07880 [Legionellaceae bacterium]|nr:hypothetical protein [Legionellaceae bacterium]MBP9775099.1 hypothetical protein [Legionellaceae bacterium]